MKKLALNKLSIWQQQVFAAALLQRMLPNYAYFSNAAKFGDYQLLVNQIDIIWQKLSLLPVKFNVELQLEKLQSNIADYAEFDFFAVYPANDVCSAMVCLLESFDEKETDCAANVSLLSLNGVTAYLEFKLTEENVATDNSPNNQVINSQTIQLDPLYLWEVETQQELFELALKSNPSRKNCNDIKMLAMSEKLTNLAIEY